MVFLALILGVASDSIACWGTRPLSMGGAFSAVSDDVHGIYWNPAGLTGVKHFDLTYSRWLSRRDIVNYDDFAAGALSLGICTLGVGLTCNHDKKNEWSNPRYKRYVINKEEDRYVNCGCGVSLGKALSLGLNINTIKTDYQGTDVKSGVPFTCSDDTYLLDLGLLWKVGSGISLGVLAQNLNEPRMYYPEIMKGEIYIFNLRPGIAWRPVKNIVLAADVYDALNNSRGDRDVRLGMEARALDSLVIRLGRYHVFDSKLRADTAGFGWKFAGWKVDYGCMYWETIADVQHMLALGYAY